MFSAVLQGGGTLESTRIHTFSPLMGKSESFHFWDIIDLFLMEKYPKKKIKKRFLKES